jgi:hypothetical protein
VTGSCAHHVIISREQALQCSRPLLQSGLVEHPSIQKDLLSQVGPKPGQELLGIADLLEVAPPVGKRWLPFVCTSLASATSHGNGYQYMVGLPNCAWYDTARTARLLKRVKPMLNTL